MKNEITISLTTYENVTFINVKIANDSLGYIAYENKARNYFAKMDFDTLHTENVTYGEKNVRELFDYLQASRKQQQEKLKNNK